MNKLQTVVSALYTLDQNPGTMDPYDNFLKSLTIISKLPVIVAHFICWRMKPILIWLFQTQI